MIDPYPVEWLMTGDSFIIGFINDNICIMIINGLVLRENLQETMDFPIEYEAFL